MASVYPKESNRIKYPHRSFKRLNKRNKSKRKKEKSNWKKLVFPERVNLIRDPNVTLKYFNLAYKYYESGYNVDYDLSEVVHFSPESIAVLAACIASKDYTNDKNSKGNSPSNQFVAYNFEESGFFEHVRKIDGKAKLRPRSGANLMHKVTNNKVEPDVVNKTCRYVLDKSNLQYIDDLEPLYDILIEAMQNTNNHASLKEEGEYDWWLYTYEEKSKKLIHFTFLDIGVGVFKSLPVVDYIRKVSDSLNLTSNLDLVEKLLKGKIKSRTKRKERGKGIPQIYELSKDKMFKEFKILTNDVIIDTKSDESFKLDDEFYGTLYYWTIETDN